MASTKAFTTQLAVLYLLAAKLRASRGLAPVLSPEERRALAHLPKAVSDALAIEPQIEELARRYQHASDFLFLGRGLHYPVALEGALKLKEISYIHAEGYPAGEMKHGPIALVDENLPVVRARASRRVAREDAFESARGQVARRHRDRSRHAAGRGGRRDRRPRDPRARRRSRSSSRSSRSIPLQLFAYHVAVRRGCDVDQPRNLAKSVTVE